VKRLALLAGAALCLAGCGGKPAAPLAWTAQASGTGNALYAIIYENRKFLVAGDHGTLLESSDGAAWKALSPGTASDLRTVIFAKGQYVVVGGDGTILTSADGVTWVPRASGTTAFLYGLTYANGRFVVWGDDGVVLTSSDGATWQNGSPLRQSSPHLVYGKGQFVGIFARWTMVNGAPAVGNTSILGSPDGMTWTDRGGIGKCCRALAFADGRFVAMGDPERGSVFTSDDGLKWSARVDEQSRPARFVTHAGGQYVMLTDEYYGDPEKGKSRILTSGDGLAWTARHEARGDLYRVYFGAGRYVVLGRQSYYRDDMAALIATSADGKAWTAQTFSGMETQSFNDVIYADGRFVAVGGKGRILSAPAGRGS